MLEPLLDGKADAAIMELQREWPFMPGSTADKGSSVSKAEQLKVFTRDRFQCRYCGTRTVFLGEPVLFGRSCADFFSLGFTTHWKAIDGTPPPSAGRGSQSQRIAS